jgi:hypothetical protein
LGSGDAAEEPKRVTIPRPKISRISYFLLEDFSDVAATFFGYVGVFLVFSGDIF